MGEDLVAVASFPSEHEAQLARIRLEEEGIESVVSDAVISNIYWFYTQAVGGVKVMVKRSEAARAAEILGSRAPAGMATAVELEEAAEDSQPEEPFEARLRCIRCRSSDTYGRRSGKGLAIGSLLLPIVSAPLWAIPRIGPYVGAAAALASLIGFPVGAALVLFGKRRYRCDACGFEWRK
jgi:hypothetical protein